MAAAAAHSMPPFPLPALPRVRPPPIPKGTPGPNTLPMPSQPSSKNLVWADGKWNSPRSSAAKHKKAVVARQLEKALRHETLGMNIYAYRHIRTNQVVYSLTKNMEVCSISYVKRLRTNTVIEQQDLEAITLPWQENRTTCLEARYVASLLLYTIR